MKLLFSIFAAVAIAYLASWSSHILRHSLHNTGQIRALVVLQVLWHTAQLLCAWIKKIIPTPVGRWFCALICIIAFNGEIVTSTPHFGQIFDGIRATSVGFWWVFEMIVFFFGERLLQYLFKIVSSLS